VEELSASLPGCFRLKSKAQAEFHLPEGKRDGRLNLPEPATGHVRVRVREVRSIADVIDLRPELTSDPFGDRKVLEQSKVQVRTARATQDVASRRARSNENTSGTWETCGANALRAKGKRKRRHGYRNRLVVVESGAHLRLKGLLDIGPDIPWVHASFPSEVCACAARTTVHGHAEWLPSLQYVDAVDLPSADDEIDRPREAVCPTLSFAKRQFVQEAQDKPVGADPDWRARVRSCSLCRAAAGRYQ